jgi:hypothetical protein
MKTILLVVGILALLMGLLWIGQGTGFVHWPASSFMIDQRPWALRGAILAAVGLILIRSRGGVSRDELRRLRRPAIEQCPGRHCTPPAPMHIRQPANEEMPHVELR